MIPCPKFGRSSAGPGWASTSKAGLLTAAVEASQKRMSEQTYVGIDVVALGGGSEDRIGEGERRAET